MKKYVLTETQIKKVVDKLIQEQTDIQSTTATVQCFLNQIMNAKLVVDGKMGPNSQTENTIKIFQEKKLKSGFDIAVDGQWGYRTQNTLTPAEKQVWESCRRKYERG